MTDRSAHTNNFTIPRPVADSARLVETRRSTDRRNRQKPAPDGSVHIILLTSHNPRDVSKWSGTIFSIYNALIEADVAVTSLHIGSLNLAARATDKILRLVRLSFDHRFSVLFSTIAGLYISARLAFAPDGPIVAVATSGLLPFLKTKRPIIYISDATFAATARLNPNFGHLPDWKRKRGDRNEQLSLRRSEVVIYPSDWAASSAREDYSVPAERITVLPFGPNIPEQMIDGVLPKKPPLSEVRLLFVSTDWKIKDGDKVIDICKALKASGANVHLDTVGNTPAHIRSLDFVTDHGFLSKANDRHHAKICELYRNAHFLLLPSTADAFGLVLVEAQAFATIPVAGLTGGMPSAICPAARGLLLPTAATADEYAAAMLPYIQDERMFSGISAECMRWRREIANWSNWAATITAASRAVQ